MFEDFSERARRIIFFSRILAGRRGGPRIEAEHLIEALILEDQAEYPKMFLEGSAPHTARMALPAHRPFFAAEVAAEIRRGLEPLMFSTAKALPTSLDMPVSDAALRVLRGAKELRQELRGEPATPSPIHVGDVEPLHLLAAALSDATFATAEVLKRVGLTKETVIAAIKSGGYS
jgi:hypothetical protein